MKDIAQAALKIEQHVTEMRRHLHMHPEVGWMETETTAYIKKELADISVSSLNTLIRKGYLIESKKEQYRVLYKEVEFVNEPVLTDGMIPVYYDNTTNSWHKAENKNTYNIHGIYRK